MAIKTSGSVFTRYSTLAILYFVQGAPYGFQTACLPLLLRQTGFSFTSLSVMKLLFIPWICKPLYAPLIERTRSHRWWLLTSLLTLAGSCLIAVLIVQEEDLFSLSFILLLMNTASAAQDVCVDSLALKILLPSELGAGNTIQVVAYKAGAVASGTILLWCRELMGWISMWMIFCLLYFGATALVVAVMPNDDKVNKKMENNNPWSSTVIFNDLHKVLAVPGTFRMMAFVLFYKLAERGESIIPIYLVDRGVSLSRLGLLTGLFRSLASVFGSGIGGYLISNRKFDPVTVLSGSAWSRCLPMLLQFVIISSWGFLPLSDHELDLWNNDVILLYSLVVSLCLSAFIGGLLTTSCFTAMMTLSRKANSDLQGSHYSLLATMEVAGKLCFASLSGSLIDLFGLEAILLLLVGLALLTPLLVPVKINNQ